MSSPPEVDIRAHRDRLESWKEIAAYLSRSERTVRRWEADEGLPVHRQQHNKRGSIFGYTSELDAWRESRQSLVDMEPQDAGPPPFTTDRRLWLRVAIIQLGLGNTEAALDWLERAADERHMGFYFPTVDPIYDSVRSHPRFRALMQRVNLPQ